MPYQLAQAEPMVQMLTPASAKLKMHHQREQASSSSPVRASQIQGQGNQDGGGGCCGGGASRGSVVTRNHSHSNLENVIEVKQVSEAEMANVFTFFNQSKQTSGGGDLQRKSNGEGSSVLDEQFTFQASIRSENKSHSDVYQTQSSNQRPRLTTQQKHTMEEEKKDCRAFLDEEILQIDNILSNTCDDGNEYSATQHNLNYPRQSNAVEHQNGPNGGGREKICAQLEPKKSRASLEASKFPQTQESVPQSMASQQQQRDSAQRQDHTSNNMSSSAGKVFGRSSQPRNTTPFPTAATRTIAIDQVTPARVSKPKNGANTTKASKQGTSPFVPNPSAASKLMTMDQSNNSYHSGKRQQPIAPPSMSSTQKLQKAKTLAHLRPQTASHQLSSTQSISQTRIKMVDPNLQHTSETKSRGSQSSKIKAPQKTVRMATRAVTSQGLGTNFLLRATQSAYDLKQKVDKQANMLVEAMQRSQSKNKQLQVTQEKPRVGPDAFVAHQLLGTGSFGEVFLIERKQDKKLLAMKVLCKKKIKQQNLKKYAITERNVMCSMGAHPFIVQLRYAFQTREHLFLISDYCPGGDLSQYLEIEGSFTEEKARLYVQEILLGIEALHKRNIIFRDLKPDNVIIDKHGHAMLTDFGLSRENVRRSEAGAKSFCGSYAYLAPEMLKKNGHGKAVDWYLLGVILFEMVTGLPPYYADDKDQLFKNIMKDTIDMRQVKSEQNISDECIDLMQKLLMKDPTRRIGTKRGASEIIAHPFFKKTNWEAVYRKDIQMPEPYLAAMAMDIIRQQPYLVAGHPHTVGDICPREHRSYLPGWSFIQPEPVGTASMLSSSEKLEFVEGAENCEQQQQQHQENEEADHLPWESEQKSEDFTAPPDTQPATNSNRNPTADSLEF